jgi:uncharacterized membrane protein YhdT
MKSSDPFAEKDIKRLQTFVYLIPVVGFFPALWTLYRRQGNQEQLTASRLAVLLATGWLFGYMLLGTGAQSSGAMHLPLLLMSSLLTSGYFLVNIWLMVRLWQRKSLKLPGISRLGDRLP